MTKLSEDQIGAIAHMVGQATKMKTSRDPRKQRVATNLVHLGRVLLKNPESDTEAWDVYRLFAATLQMVDDLATQSGLLGAIVETSGIPEDVAQKLKQLVLLTALPDVMKQTEDSLTIVQELCEALLARWVMRSSARPPTDTGLYCLQRESESQRDLQLFYAGHHEWSKNKEDAIVTGHHRAMELRDSYIKEGHNEIRIVKWA